MSATPPPTPPHSPAEESVLALCAKLLPEGWRQRLRYARQSHAIRQQFACDAESKSVLHAAHLAFTRPMMRIGFYPQVPYQSYVLFKALSVLGWSVERLSPASDVAVFWDDATDFTGDDAVLHRHRWVINGHCRDISKRRVDATFAKVAGYGVQVDPLTHRGPMVCKADANAAHDGRVIDGPITTPELASVYQRVIDNEIAPGAGVIEDMRLPVIGRELPLVYVKRRPKATRFSNKNTDVALAEVHDLFTSEEIAIIRRFVTEFHLDYGEIDVLRDRQTGRIYIIDVNKTPFGPPNGLPAPQATEAVNRIALALTREWPVPVGAAA